MDILFCNVPGCTVKAMSSDKAWVPALSAIRQATGKPVTAEALADHALCGRHSHEARKSGVKAYRYEQTLEEISKRTESKLEAVAAQSFFTRYGTHAKASLGDVAAINQSRREAKAERSKEAVA